MKSSCYLITLPDLIGVCGNDCSEMEYIIIQCNVIFAATAIRLFRAVSQQTRYTKTMLFYRWANVFDAGPLVFAGIS